MLKLLVMIYSHQVITQKIPIRNRTTLIINLQIINTIQKVAITGINKLIH
jgi:hypothetical protein